jgi:hypothetical protein
MVEDFLARLSSRVGRIEDGSHDRVPDIATTRQVESLSNLSPPPPDSIEDTAPELQDPTDGIGSVVFTEEENSGFFGMSLLTSNGFQRLIRTTGPTSNIAFTRQVVRTTTGILQYAASIGTPVSPDDSGLKSYVIHMSRPSFPALDFSSSTNGISIGAEPFILPSENEMTRLIELYFNSTGLLFPFIDYGGFVETYRQLITTSISSVRRSWLGLLNMIFAIATSVHNGQDPITTARAHATGSDAFYRRAMVLSDRHIRHGTSLEVGMSLHCRTLSALLKLS